MEMYKTNRAWAAFIRLYRLRVATKYMQTELNAGLIIKCVKRTRQKDSLDRKPKERFQPVMKHESLGKVELSEHIHLTSS